MSAYSYPDEPVSRALHGARISLTEGLALLSGSMHDMLSLTLRGEGGTRRARQRPHPNETPTRHLPGGNTKPIGARVATPPRPTMPTQPGGGSRTDGGPSGTDAETALLPVIPAGGAGPPGGPGAPEGPAPPSGPPTGYPDRPDPSDPALAVWALVERAQAGEAEAFGLIYDRYVDTVFRFVYFRVGNRQLAEDLTSDTFLRALKRIGSFTWQGRDLGAWLVTIARNLVADHFKSGRYRLEITTSDVMDAEREDRGPEGSPEAAVVNHITNVALLTAVKQLNPEQQECIVLRFLQGFSVAETARTMGKNEGAIKALQYRAVRALARLLPDGFQP